MSLSQEEINNNKRISIKKSGATIVGKNKCVGISKYKYVYPETNGFKAYLSRLKVNKYYPTEREAALRIDMALIENGEEPVNILKKKL